jgi:hypothetical protein
MENFDSEHVQVEGLIPRHHAVFTRGSSLNLDTATVRSRERADLRKK